MSTNPWQETNSIGKEKKLPSEVAILTGASKGIEAAIAKIWRPKARQSS